MSIKQISIKQLRFFKGLNIFIVLSLVVGALLFFPSLSSAHSGHSNSPDSNKSIGAITSEIQQSQNLKAGDKIDCTKVSKEKFIELGDAIMEEMHPGEQHELMDRMMGGEGSASLTAMHIAMGERYLGCSNDTIGENMMMGMGSGSMMGGANDQDGGWGMMNNGGWGMMNNGGHSGFGLVLMISFLILIIVSIIALSRWLLNRSYSSTNKTALDILKERYAKGEIEEKEFLERKNDLS